MVFDKCKYILLLIISFSENVKALYRRGKAHVGAWNPDKAEEDFILLKTIDPSMTAVADKELANIKQMRKTKENEDKDALKKLFTSTTALTT